LAQRLAGTTQLTLHPSAPHTNAFQVWLPGTPAELARRNRAFARTESVWLFNGFQPAPLDGWSFAEIVIGEAADDWTVDEAADWIESFAGQPAGAENLSR
jgi:hypothetical protein